MTAREVDVHKLPAMLTALRLPSFQAHWQDFAERADKESWPAAKFLAALAECELAERAHPASPRRGQAARRQDAGDLRLQGVARPAEAPHRSARRR